MKNILLLAILFISCAFISACLNLSDNSLATYNKQLVELKKITFPVDENMYYFSRALFQYEEDGKEFLHFENTEKNQYEIIIYDIKSQEISRRIQLHKQGPNGVPAVMGSKPLGNSHTSALFQNSLSRITFLNDKGEVIRKYPIKSFKAHFLPFLPSSDFYTPTFMKDSVLYVASLVYKPNLKKEDWRTMSLFFQLNLNSGEVNLVPIYYPSVFYKNVKNIAMGAEFSYDYNHRENRLVCSFIGYDSLMVSDDLHSIKWYDGKSRYLGIKRPNLIEASEGLQAIFKAKEEGYYNHIMYDKFRDIYYRFVEHPCKLSTEDAYSHTPKDREFSVIIFDKDLRIIGETKFPGNKYDNRMSFVGRDGLYISENNLANPEFDENKLVFACFKLEDIKGKE